MKTEQCLDSAKWLDAGGGGGRAEARVTDMGSWRHEGSRRRLRSPAPVPDEDAGRPVPNPQRQGSTSSASHQRLGPVTRRAPGTTQMAHPEATEMTSDDGEGVSDELCFEPVKYEMLGG